MRDKYGRVIPSNYLGNYSDGVVMDHPGKRYAGNQHWPGESHPASDVLPKQSYMDVSYVSPLQSPKVVNYKVHSSNKPTYIPPLYGTEKKPTRRQAAAKKLRMPKKEIIKYNY